MKRASYIPIFLALLMTQLIAVNPSTASAQDWSSWKNWYGVVWRETPAGHMKYAKQMGYDYIGIANWRIPSQYHNDANAANLNFYFVEPQRLTNLYDGIVAGASPSKIDEGLTYTTAQQAWYENYMVWKSNASFPQNLASGVMVSSAVYNSMWDFQQQVVIDKVVDGIIAEAQRFDDPSIPFIFAGYIIDEPKLNGQFFRWDATKNKGVNANLSYWTGVDSGLLHGAITHEYATYSDGMAAFYKQLNTKMRQAFPNAKWIIAPWKLYSTATLDEWINKVKNRADKDQLIPDMLSQESDGTEFVDDSNIFNSGMNITKNMVGTSQPRKSAEYENRLYAAKAGINGAWYNWFGLFSEGDITVNFLSITQVYPRLQVVKIIPNWDNLNNIPLANRTWDGSVYQSKTSSGSLQSYISSDVMYSRHWKTGRLFAVFNSTSGVIRLNPGETAASLQKTDGYFIEAGDAASDFAITAGSTGAEIILKSSVIIPIDSTNGQVQGVGYILTISTAASGNPAPVITSAPTSTGTVGTGLSYQMTASNGPTSFNAAGLPAGLSVSTTTGLIAGTPTAAATSSVTLSASNAGGTGTKTLSLTIYSACDVNRDGSTNVVDVQLQVNQALGAAACTSDLNRDGKCNVIDVQRDVNAGLGGPCVVGP